VLNANRLTPLPGVGTSATPVPPPTSATHVLPVHNGQEIAARVLQVKMGGALLALAGSQVEVRTQVPLKEGQTLRMRAEVAGDGAIRLHLGDGAPASRGPMDVIGRVVAGTPGAGGATAPPGITPLQASAFARLAAADLPTSPVAVRGLAGVLQGPTMGAMLTQLQAALGSGGSDPTLQAQARALAATIASLTGGATLGPDADLAAMARMLGRGVEARLVAGDASDVTSLRSNLLALAGSDSASMAVRQMAGDIAAQISAQALAGVIGDGQYLQLPLPGGASAEILLPDPDDGDGRGGGARSATTARILLDLPTLGRVEVDAIVATDATMARVRARDDGGRLALADALPELRQALAGRGDVHVQIEPAEPATSLLPPPPPLGLEMEA